MELSLSTEVNSVIDSLAMTLFELIVENGKLDDDRFISQQINDLYDDESIRSKIREFLYKRIQEYKRAGSDDIPDARATHNPIVLKSVSETCILNCYLTIVIRSALSTSSISKDVILAVVNNWESLTKEQKDDLFLKEVEQFKLDENSTIPYDTVLEILAAKIAEEAKEVHKDTSLQFVKAFLAKYKFKDAAAAESLYWSLVPYWVDDVNLEGSKSGERNPFQASSPRTTPTSTSQSVPLPIPLPISQPKPPVESTHQPVFPQIPIPVPQSTSHTTLPKPIPEPVSLSPIPVSASQSTFIQQSTNDRNQAATLAEQFNKDGISLDSEEGLLMMQEMFRDLYTRTKMTLLIKRRMTLMKDPLYETYMEVVRNQKRNPEDEMLNDIIGEIFPGKNVLELTKIIRFLSFPFCSTNTKHQEPFKSSLILAHILGMNHLLRH